MKTSKVSHKSSSLNAKAGVRVQCKKEGKKIQERDREGWIELVKVPSYRRELYRAILNVLKD